MSVLIKGMDMPDSCRHCCMMTGTFCDVLNIDVDPYYDGAKHRNVCCPLVEIPKHGRLIDGDEVITAFPVCDSNMDVKIESVRATIDHMPTVIEAEDEG